MIMVIIFTCTKAMIVRIYLSPFKIQLAEHTDQKIFIIKYFNINKVKLNGKMNYS